MAARKTRLSPSGGCTAVVLVLALQSGAVLAGAQRYEPLSASVQAQLQRAIADQAAPRLAFDDRFAGQAWLKTMSSRLAPQIPDESDRLELLTTIHYEATRAGLDPQMVLGLIHVESHFRKFAVSHAGARGYMQVMPFWVDAIGAGSHNLFNLRTNLRYGCTILRHYLDIEKGNVYRALGRYNGSLGKAGYPQRVHRAWMQSWRYERDPLAGRSPAPAAARSQRSAGQG